MLENSMFGLPKVAVIRCRFWNDECVIYNQLTGETHLIDGMGAEIFKLISEKTLHPISAVQTPKLNFQDLAIKAETLVTQKISESDKIEELVKDAVLNRWVNEGRTHHKSKRNKCARMDRP